MLGGQIRHQGESFLEEGGLRERLTQCRIEARDAGAEPAPVCPECGKPMRQRKSAKGEFWGCSAYPDCKGIRPV
jgi:ribosomal protein L37AE/L43A